MSPLRTRLRPKNPSSPSSRPNPSERSRTYAASDPSRPTYRQAGDGATDMSSASVTPTDEYASVHEHAPAGARARPSARGPRAPAGSGARRRRTAGPPARRTRATRQRREVAHVRSEPTCGSMHTTATPGRPPSAAPGGGHAARAPGKGADLDDPPAGRQGSRRAEQAAGLGLGQPALDIP